MGAVVAEALEPFVLRNFPLLEGEVRFGNKIQPLESDFLDRDHLLNTQLELSLNLGRDQHRETQSLILNLVEADGLLEGEHGEGTGVVAVDKRKKLLIRCESRYRDFRFFSSQHLGLGSEFFPQRIEAGFLFCIKGEIRPHTFNTEEHGYRARVVRRTRGGAKGCGRQEHEHNGHTIFRYHWGRLLNLEALGDDLFELNDIRRKLPNAISELVGSHGVLVEHPAEGLFVEIDFFDVVTRRLSGIQLASERCGGVLEILEKIGADREQVATSEFGDLADVPEAGAHHLRLVAELFVVVVDLFDGLDTGILRANVFFAGSGFVVIVNAANERRDEARVGLGAGDSLW